MLIRISALVKQAIQESRELINSLQPPTLKDLGLVATLRHEMRQLEQELGWVTDFKSDAIRLPKDVETGLYRIIHEAVTNLRKHAYQRSTDMQQVRVTLYQTESNVKVKVQDWGRGFDTDNPDSTPGNRGLGLFSMRRTAEILQGICNIQSAPGQGTTVHIEIPRNT